jgi:LPXTG-motif cell wall-anchored protein
MRQAHYWIILSAVCLVPLSTTAAPSDCPGLVQSIDVSEFPTIRAYVCIDKPFTDGTEVLVSLINGGLSEDDTNLLKRAKDTPEAGCKTVEPPSAKPAANWIGFDKRERKEESLLISLLVDASGSMGKRSRKNKITPIEQVTELAAELKPVLRDNDQMMLTKVVAEKINVVEPPTTTHDSIYSYLREDFKPDAKNAKLYDALGEVLKVKLQSYDEPALPGRRVLILFSDGRDYGSTLKVEDFNGTLRGLKHPVEVLTVGVGGHKNYKDLQRIAYYSGGNERFSADPETGTLSSKLDRVLAPLKKEARVEFRLPAHYVRKWEDEGLNGEITVKVPGAPPSAIPFEIRFNGKIPAKAQKDADTLNASIAAVQKCMAAHDSSTAKKAEDAKAATARDEEFSQLADDICACDSENCRNTKRESLKALEEGGDDRTDSAKRARECISKAEEEQQQQMYLLIGAAVLVLLLSIAGFFFRRRRTRRQQEEQEAAFQDVQSNLRHMEAGIRQQMEEERRRNEAQAEEREREAAEQARRSADAARRAIGVLFATAGPMKGQRFFMLKSPCVIGRESSQCDLAVPADADLGISRQHCRFEAGGRGDFTVTCLSQGGMGVDNIGVRTGEQYPVSFGSSITMGSSTFLLQRP